MGFKTSGFDEIEEDLDKMSKGIKKFAEKDSVTFEQLFPDSYIQKHTQFTTIEELFEKGGFVINAEEDFDSIDEKELDEHISATTDFDSWEDMLGKAFDEYAIKELGFDE